MTRLSWSARRSLAAASSSRFSERAAVGDFSAAPFAIVGGNELTTLPSSAAVSGRPARASASQADSALPLTVQSGSLLELLTAFHLPVLKECSTEGEGT
jgi:hypothetical protein